MLEITCQKQFKREGNYTPEDIKIFNSCIQQGIEELKSDWRNPESEGIVLVETENELRFELDENKIDFENMYSSLNNIKYNIMAVIDNYGIPYVVQ